MIFNCEAKACIDGVASPSEVRDIIEHYQLGGFHCNILTATRAAFTEWLEAQPQHPRQLIGNTEQLDLLTGATS